jgi:hypothetical protein
MNDIKILIQDVAKRTERQDKESKRLKEASAKLDKASKTVEKLKR